MHIPNNNIYILCPTTLPEDNCKVIWVGTEKGEIAAFKPKRKRRNVQ